MTTGERLELEFEEVEPEGARDDGVCVGVGVVVALTDC